MRVSIRGRYFDKQKRDLLKDLAKWCGHKLLGPQLSRNVTLSIHIVGPELYDRDGMYGTTDVDDNDDWDRPRNFVVTITNKYQILRSLVILAHEMVHVKQQARRELAWCGRTGKTKWHGKLIDEDDLSYWDTPWEIEAHGREKGLLYQWANDRGHCGNAKWFKEIM